MRVVRRADPTDQEDFEIELLKVIPKVCMNKCIQG